MSAHMSMHMSIRMTMCSGEIEERLAASGVTAVDACVQASTAYHTGSNVFKAGATIPPSTRAPFRVCVSRRGFTILMMNYF